MNGVWIAMMESDHYTWTAIGLTADEARGAIAKEWNEGRGSERREKMTLVELDNYYGVNYQFIEFGKCNWE